MLINSIKKRRGLLMQSTPFLFLTHASHCQRVIYRTPVFAGVFLPHITP